MRAAAIVLAMGLVGCGDISRTTSSGAPANVCAGTSGLTCAAYPVDAGVQCLSTGTGAACQLGSVAPFLLVVTIPQLAPAAGGATYAIASSDLLPVATASACMSPPRDVPVNDVCFVFPQFKSPAVPLQPAAGVYLIDSAQAVEAGRYLGDIGSASVSLPVSVTFWPQWTPPDTATTPGMPTDARLLNLPLPPVFADVENTPDFVSTDALGILTEPPGGSGSPFEWQAYLSPARSSPGYVAVVQVTSPFDDAYPDVRYPVTVEPPPQDWQNANTSTAVGLIAVGTSGQEEFARIYSWPLSGVDEPQGAGLTVTRADGKAFEEGWTAYLRDPVTLDAVSSHARLRGVSASARTNVLSSNPPASDVELVVVPPADLTGYPELIDVAPSGKTLETYPALPPVLHVSGSVQSADGEPVSATMVFSSSLLDSVTTCQAQSHPPTNLYYEARVQTDDLVDARGEVGHYSVDLPQGRYSVMVEPAAASGYAKQVTDYVPVAVPAPPVCTGASLALDGVNLEVSPVVPVTGSFTTGDGRPLSGANVDLTPASALVATIPSAYQAMAFAARDAWPRPITTMTNDAGAFSVSVDPGAYDVTVRPAGGSGFPWFVEPDRIVGAQGRKFLPAAVPAPFFLSVTLHIVSGQYEVPMPDAVVQAFAFSGGVALIIGEAITDDDGHFTMMLSTSFPSD